MNNISENQTNGDITNGTDDTNPNRKISVGGKKTSAAKASTIIEDSRSYKIIFDVYGYSENEITITVFTDTSVVIEGQTETQADGKISKKSFKKPYTLPSCIDVHKGICYLCTSEGTLTLSLPKKDCKEESISDPLSQPSYVKLKITNKCKKPKKK